MKTPYIFAPASSAVISTYERDDGERVFFGNESHPFKVGEHEFKVEALRCSDGFSIPKVFQGLFSKDMKGLWSALAHDMLYAKDSPYPVTRKEADQIIVALMKYYGHSWWSCRAVYRALRVGGSCTWKRRDSTYYQL